MGNLLLTRYIFNSKKSDKTACGIVTYGYETWVFNKSEEI